MRWSIIFLGYTIVSKFGGVLEEDTTQMDTANIPSNAKLCTAVQMANITTSARVRYYEVLPTDTFQGICLRYSVTSKYDAGIELEISS